MKNAANLLEGSIFGKLTRLAMPIMMTAFVQMAYNLVDMIWIGGLGSGAVAAVGAAGIYLWIADSCTSGIGEREENRFHGQEGYEQMMFLGYPDVAQICLTHTFPDKNFDRGQYSFPDEWIEWAREKLAGTVYTDYDYLIAFCDKLFEACEMVSIEKRIEAIVERYGLNADQRDLLYRESIGLKKYFDEKTGDDVYRILEIED